ncbi:MAG: hypothetical protein HWE25_15830 [Alphaproteobacteria bacterium]|nr:hypothetical protein [Alphaproteobacteria bacterium]
MNIELTIGSLLAIAALAWIAGRLFPVTKPLNEERVIRNLVRYEPDAKFDEILLSEDGQTAFVPLLAPENTIGLLHQLGDRVVCRIMGASEIAATRIDHASLTIVTQDFTQREVKLFLSEKPMATARKALNAITDTQETRHAA